MLSTRRSSSRIRRLMSTVEKQVGTVQNTIKKVNSKTKTINRKLKDVGSVEMGAPPISLMEVISPEASVGLDSPLVGQIPQLAASEEEEFGEDEDENP